MVRRAKAIGLTSMKTNLLLIGLSALALQAVPAPAQLGGQPGGLGGSPRGPSFGGSIGKLFGDNSAFTATLELQTKGGPTDERMTIPGKLAFDQGKSRFEMDMSLMQGAKMPPGVGAQMKAMGMERLVTISRPDKKSSYMVYPGLQSYLEMLMQDSKTDGSAEDFKMETTELGKETVDGHPCIKNRAVVTDKEGKKHESTVWNATDLKDFPVKIQTADGGAQVSMIFRDVKLSKPDSSQFDRPTNFKKYDDMMTMMQQGMMKRFSEGQKATPGKNP